MINNQIKNMLAIYRERCEAVWCEETASPKLRPIAGKPLSTGQCSATSIVLGRIFARQQVDGYFKIAVGAVYDAHDQTALIPLHVWLQHYADNFSEPEIIDITADQSLGIKKKILYASPTHLLKEGLIYQVWSLLDENQCKIGTLERAKLLERLLQLA
jgi:hypothetical protein